jgi:hypothetical protein
MWNTVKTPEQLEVVLCSVHIQQEQQCKLTAGAGERETLTMYHLAEVASFMARGFPRYNDGCHHVTSARRRSMLHAAETLRCGVMLHHVQKLLKLSTVMRSATAVRIFLYKMRAQR